MTALKNSFILFLFLISFITVHAQEECFATNGFWSDVEEEHPFLCEDIDDGKTLIISVGITVTIDEKIDLTGVTNLIIRGTLFFDGNTSRLTMPDGSGVVIEEGGTLETNVSNNSQKLRIGTKTYWTSKNGNIGGPQKYGEGPLPVELISFKAQLEEEKVSLRWTTASEINSEVFVAEHSKDGIRFSDIGFVNASGDSEIENNYTLDHENPFSGINYYRLRQIDFDGTQNFSPVVSAVFRQADFFKLYQAADFSSINLVFKEELRNDIFVDIYDISGRLMKKEVIRRFEQEHLIDIHTFNEGQYVLTVNDGRIATSKSFVKIEA